MKKSHEAKKKRSKHESAADLLGEIPPIVIKSGGSGTSADRASEGVTIEVNLKDFYMKDHREGAWKSSFTPRWYYHEFHAYIGEDDVNFPKDDVNFPLTVDTVILLTLSTGWVKFRVEPREENPHQTTLWIEASDYIFTVTEPSTFSEQCWLISQAPGVITGVEIYPRNAISKYTCPNGNAHLELQEGIILPNPS